MRKLLIAPTRLSASVAYMSTETIFGPKAMEVRKARQSAIAASEESNSDSLLHASETSPSGMSFTVQNQEFCAWSEERMRLLHSGRSEVISKNAWMVIVGSVRLGRL